MKTRNMGDVIYKARIKQDITQKELAKKIGMHLQLISNIEGGRCLLPAKYFKKISKILKVSVNDLRSITIDNFIKRLDANI